MKKFYLIFLLTFSLLFSGVYVKANTEFCYNLRASVGETYDEVGIIYHSKYEGTKVRYSLNSDLSDYKEVTPEEKIYSKGQTNGQPETVFAARYVCRANLTGLYDATTYYYQVVYNDQVSHIQSLCLSDRILYCSEHSLVVLHISQLLASCLFLFASG